MSEYNNNRGAGNNSFSSRMRKHFLFLALGYLSVSSAQKVGDISFQSRDLDSDTVVVTLKNIEVTAQKESKETKSTTPYQEIDAGKIKEAGITDISDAMRRLAGVNLRDYGGAGGIKTVSVRGLGAAHTAVIYDGVTLSDCQTGEIDLSRYSLDNVRSINLYSGENDDIFIPARAAASSASLYINSFSLPGAFDSGSHLKAQMRFGSFGYYNPFARFDYSDEKISLSANGEYIHTRNNYPFTLVNGGYVTREKRENSQMNSWKGEMNMRWKFSSVSSLGGKIYYYDNSRNLPGPVIYYVKESHEHLRDRNFFGQLNYRGKFSSKVSLSAISKFNWSSTRYQDKDGQYPGGVLDNRYYQKEVYTSACLLIIPSRGFLLDYSVDWAWNSLVSNSTKKASDPYRHSILQSIAAKYSNERLSFLLRGLYSVYLNGAKTGEAGRNENRFSPAVSISYRLIPEHSFFIRGSYKNIFRMPTFNEAYFDNYGSINLSPETTDQFNVGLTFERNPASWLPEFQISCDGYINLVKNKIVALPYNMFLWTMSNMGKVRVFGADLNLTATFSLNSGNRLLLGGSYSYQRAQPRTNPNQYDWMKQVAYTPLNSGSISLSWLNPWVDVAVHTVGTGSRYTTNNNIAETRLPGYFDFGTSLSHKFEFKSCSLDCRFDLLNIFDKQYEIVARYPMPGRSWKLTIAFQY
ncbi:MAG: TonB-dependent receptor [Muribaculaceae bacterium]|nr:TonB-dependent receptor [Muribaculaceae bacterium]